MATKAAKRRTNLTRADWLLRRLQEPTQEGLEAVEVENSLSSVVREGNLSL